MILQYLLLDMLCNSCSMEKEDRELIIDGKPGIIFSANSLTFASLPRTDCHLHTCWTDGVGTCLEVYRTACEMKLDTILFSEHSRKTSTDWFSDFAAEVRALPKKPCPWMTVAVESTAATWPFNLISWFIIRRDRPACTH